MVSGPIPPYNNPPIQPQFFKPSQFFISNISLGNTTIVTTTVNNNYVIGQLVRLIIPPTFGCRQLNEAVGYVVSLPASNQVEIAINSIQNVDTYIASSATTKAQILAVGDINSGQTNSNGRLTFLTYIPGSFMDISPV